MYDWNICDPSTNTWLLLVQAYQASRRVAEAELRRPRITLGHFHILMLLASSKVALSPGEVASYLFREKNIISERLTRMEKLNYVKKHRAISWTTPWDCAPNKKLTVTPHNPF